VACRAQNGTALITQVSGKWDAYTHSRLPGAGKINSFKKKMEAVSFSMKEGWRRFVVAKLTGILLYARVF